MITCTFENGNKAKLRHVVIDILVIKDSKLLLVKRAEKLLEGGKWALIGGYMEIDENAAEAAAREGFEESGYRIAGLQLLWIKDKPSRPGEDRQNISLVFEGIAGEQEGKSDWEVTDQKWVSFDDLPPKEEMAFDHYEDIQKYLRYKAGEKIPMLEVTP